MVNFHVVVGHCQHLQLPLHDDEEANLLQHLPAALSFIDDALSSGGRCLVHCQAGMSRSVSIVSAYMMKKGGMSDPQDALQVLHWEGGPIIAFLGQAVCMCAALWGGAQQCLATLVLGPAPGHTPHMAPSRAE